MKSRKAKRDGLEVSWRDRSSFRYNYTRTSIFLSGSTNCIDIRAVEAASFLKEKQIYHKADGKASTYSRMTRAIFRDREKQIKARNLNTLTPAKSMVLVKVELQCLADHWQRRREVFARKKTIDQIKKERDLFVQCIDSIVDREAIVDKQMTTEDISAQARENCVLIDL